jgi:chromosome partitioning protein
VSNPHIVAVANMAGSAGKTTTVVTLAALLAQEGQRVAVLDLDAQATATFSLGVDDVVERQLATIGDVLLRRAKLHEALVQTSAPGVQLVPASNDLNGAAVVWGRAVGGEQRLRRALTSTPLDVDVVLLDCPGALNIYTLNALVAADVVVAVTQPTTKELAGLPTLEETIEDVGGAYNEDLKLAAIVPCIVPSTGALYAQGLQLLRETYDGLVTHPVRRSVRVPEAYDAGRPLPLFAPTHDATQDYREVLRDLRAAGALPALSQEV